MIDKLDLGLEGLLTAFQFHTEHAFSKQPELDAVFDEYLPKFKALISTEVAKARRETFMSANVACSFNPDCKNCHANELTLGYLIKPETTNPKSNKEGVEVNE